MRFRIMLFLIVALGLVITPAMAKEHPKSFDYRMPSYTVTARAYFEGFEGAFPPAGWTQSITNPSYTWTTDTFSPYEGLVNAYIPWQVGVPQLEMLSFSHPISTVAGEDHLVFATMGSPFWSSNGNMTVEVNGTEVFNYYLDNLGVSFQWELHDIDLSAYDGTTVAIDFIYAGDDGADHHLDAVEITEEYVPPPPPPGENCDNVVSIIDQGLMQWDVDLCLYADDFSDPGGCTGYSAFGSDAVYSIYLLAGENFYATENGPHDMALYLVTDCYNASTTCVVGSDNCCSGAEESISYAVPTAGWYYLVVDSYSGCGLVTVTIEGVIAAEEASWGTVKSMYK